MAPSLYKNVHTLPNNGAKRNASPLYYELSPHPTWKKLAALNNNTSEVVPTVRLASVLWETQYFGLSQPGAVNKSYPLFVFVISLMSSFCVDLPKLCWPVSKSSA